ncbi:MAG: cobalamin-dependent protein [Thermoplasmata archaeon]|nr:cobalamin-dependent protein [Thermoplasmata archaeon]
MENVRNAILHYDIKNINSLVQKAMDSGAAPGEILDEGMISAMDEIGTGFKENRIFMPQMLVAAKTMQSGLELLKPHLKGDASASKAGKAVVGSVMGDVHDIGKNIVAIMLEGIGLEVVDLGADVPNEQFLEAIRDGGDVKYVAASSSMTPTRASLKAVVESIKGSEYRDSVVVMVGGATMDQLYCDEIGADIYTADAASASQRAKEIKGGRPVSDVAADSRNVAMASMGRMSASSEEADEEFTGIRRHLLEPAIRQVGHSERKPLSTKDNLLETLKHEKGCPDRYVNQYGFFDLVFDPVLFRSFNLGAFFGGVPEFEDGWGVPQQFPAGSGGPHPSGTVIKDITHWQDYVKPPSMEFTAADWAPTKEQAAGIRGGDKFLGIAMLTGLFERTHFHLGMQEALVEYYEHPEEMQELIDYFTEWEIQSLDEVFANIEPEVLFHHDDWGTAINSFLDPVSHRKFFYEPYKKIYNHFRELGGEIVIHHSDSWAANLVPIWCDMGVDIWQGPIADNNIPDLIDRYGDKLTFMGGIDDAFVDIPDWNAEVVAKYVEQQCDAIGTTSFIPCLTRGLGMSVFPGVYDCISETIDKVSARKF